MYNETIEKDQSIVRKVKMKPHQICKKAGLKSLAQLSEISGVSIQTLNNWAKNKPKLFKCLIYGASEQKYFKTEEGRTILLQAIREDIF